MSLIPLTLFLVIALIVFACVLADRRKKRADAGLVPISVIVPCHNDGATVADTLRSVFASWPHEALQVIAINDCSTDDSLNRIRDVAEEFDMEVIDHRNNIGKAQALNRAFANARHEFVLCLDADSMISREALKDMLARLTHDVRVGAVSCPYSPANRGFLPAMQAIEYSMLRIGQGAGNVTSSLALWGGCLMVRKNAFLAVGRFSVNAITEDVDLAFKLCRKGWRVEQSFVFIRTHVPSTFAAWLRQKIRWTAGGFQCVFRYPGVWMRNPLQMMFVFAYAALTVTGLSGLWSDHSLLKIGDEILGMAESMPMETLWDTTLLKYGPILLVKFSTGMGFGLFSLIYVIPTLSKTDSMMRLLLFIPFSFGYFPLYILISAFGFAFWFLALRRIGKERRAW